MNEEMTPKPKWFNIAEAAQYLDVGEPTIYRWVREGKISYRKVGDSTRFLKEDLDSKIEVYTAGKTGDGRTREGLALVCPTCNAGTLVEGKLQSTGLNYFVPKRTKFWTFLTSNIETHARMCDACGVLTLFGDLPRLHKLRETPVAETEITPPLDH